MLLVFCFILIFASVYYGRRYYRKTKKPVDLKYNQSLFDKRQSLKKKKMSDDEFQNPSAAFDRWQTTNGNKVVTPNRGGLFRWKRNPSSNIPDDQVCSIEKRQKLEVVKQKAKFKDETVDLTEDESEASVIDDETIQRSISPVKKKLDSNEITIIDSSSDESLSPVKNKFDNENSLVEKILPEYSKTESPRNFKSIYDNIPLPPGMPPVIAGVPVKFPVSPYRSQISVMNSVIKGCKNEEHCLLESPTGSGKTLALLCAALAWQTSFEESHFSETSKTSKNPDPDGKAASCQTGVSDDCCVEKVLLNSDKSPKKKTSKVPKIYYGSRTHKQIEQVVREFRKTAYANKPMTILSSREYTCIQKVEGNISKTRLCNDLRDPVKKKGCKFYTEKNRHLMARNCDLDSHGLETPWDIEDLVELGRRIGACPYFAARSLMEEADIIFCPYNYLIDPVIRDTMKIDLRGDVIIVDEAHNIESICRDVGSSDVREDHLGEAIEDCKLVCNLLTGPAGPSPTYQILVDYLEKLKVLINDQILPGANDAREEVASECWTGEQAWLLFKLHNMTDHNYQLFKDSCKIAIDDYNTVKEDIQSGMANMHLHGEEDEYGDNGEKKQKSKKTPAITFVTKKLIEELLMALEAIQNPTYHLDYRCTITQAYCYDAKVKVDENTWVTGKGAKRLRTFKFMCMNSALVFSQVAKMARNVILASGTLSPTSTFESELGTRFAQKLHANHVVTKDQVYIRGIRCGPNGTTLRATYRHVQTLPFKDDLGRLILEVCKSVPHGVLCFFSSYTTMKSQIERWRETEIWSELQSCKHVLEEPRNGNELDDVMRDYREVIKSTAEKPRRGITGSLLFAVFRGKVAEGIDFSDNEARCVLTVGIPYAVQNDPVIKLKREYNDSNRDRGLLPGGEWYSVQAYRALNQALGRCIRHRNDWGAVLLVDERLLSSVCTSYLPKWIREMRQDDTDFNLKDELKAFVKKQQECDQERKSN